VFPAKINLIIVFVGRDDLGKENEFSTSFCFVGKFLGLAGEAVKFRGDMFVFVFLNLSFM